MPTRLLPVTAVLLAAVSVAACTSSGTSTGPSSTATTTTGSSSSQSGSTVSTSSPARSSSSSATAPLATFTSLGGRSTTMSIDPAFARTLYTKSITTKASGDARLTPVGNGSRIVLPITGGRMTLYRTSAESSTSGTVQHAGSGLELGNADGVTVRIDDVELVLGSHPAVSAQLATSVNGATGPTKPVQLFTLRESSATRTGFAHGVGTMSGVRLYLTRAAATALNAALETTAFRGSSEIYAGTVSLALVKR